MRWLFAAAAAVLLGLTGCNRPPDIAISIGGPSGTSTWAHALPGDRSTPGIDEGSAYWAGRLLVIWSDSPNGTTAGSTGGPNGFTADGWLTTRDRRRVPFKATSPDGKTGKLVIDGVEYDLAAGRLFLVATSGGKVQVKQLATDWSGLNLESPDFRAFAKGDREIQTFFGLAK